MLIALIFLIIALIFFPQIFSNKERIYLKNNEENKYKEEQRHVHLSLEKPIYVEAEAWTPSVILLLKHDVDYYVSIRK